MRVSGQYCASRCASSGGHDFTKIEILQSSTVIFSNTNGCGVTGTGSGSILGRYANYRNQVIKLQKGQTYTLNAYFSTCSSPVIFAGYTVVYLDLNKNYIFDTSSERIVKLGPITIAVGGTYTFTANFTIPNSVSIDSTRLRIIAGYEASTGNVVQPCDTAYFRGETEDYTVTFCDPISRTIAKVNPKCFGDSTGKVKINTTGGLAPIAFSWNGGGYLPLDSLKNIPAGTYTLITKDSLGCKNFDTIVLTQPPSLNNTKTIDSSCWDAPNGKISVNGIGGLPPYTYKIMSGSFGTKKTWDTLAKGIYIVQIKDSNQCVKLDTIVIDTFKKFNHFVLIDSVYCYNSNSGTITVSSSTPSKFNGYSRNGGMFQTSGVFGGLPSGTHYMQSRDVRNCMYYDTISLSNPSPMKIVTITTKDIGCTISNDGIIKVGRSGGRNSFLVYIYKWSHLGSLTNIDSFGNLIAGSYKIILQDQFLCAKDSISINLKSIKDSFKMNLTLQNSHKCNYDSFNIIQFSANGGKSPYQFSHNFGAWTSVDTAHIFHNTSNVFTGNIRIKDSTGCIIDSTYLLRPLSNPSITVSQKNKPSCGGTNTAIIEFLIAQPDYSVRPLSFSFNNSPYQSDSIFSNIYAENKTYPISYRDALGCNYNDSVTTTAYPILSASVSMQPNVCIGDKIGQISLNVSGGVAPYQYSINGGGFQASNTFTNLASGNYTIVVRDSANCSITKSVLIPAVSFSFTINIDKSLKCFGDSNAQFTALLTGSTPSYSFQNGAYSAVNSWSNLKAGMYNVKIKYNTSCVIDTNITITQPQKLNNTLTKTDNLCFGQKMGTITAVPSGGVVPYTFYLNSASKGSQTVFNQLGAGAYEVKLIDNNLCEHMQSITIDQSALLAIQHDTIIQPNCTDKNSGKISISITGGSTPYSIKWSTNDINIYSRSNLTAGVYKITANDKNGCKDSTLIVLNAPISIALSLNKREMRCYNDTNASLEVITNGGTSPYSYQWNDGITSAIRTKLLPNIYYLIQVVDALGCKDTIGYLFKNPPELTLQLKKTDATCYNSTDGQITSIASGGTLKTNSNYLFSIDSGVKQALSYFANLKPKIYTVRTYDDEECQAETTATILGAPRILISLDSVYSISRLGTTVQLKPTIQGSAGDLHYRWYPSIGLSCADCLDPVFNGYVDTYTTFYILYNNNKCIDSALTRIRINHIVTVDSIYIPTAFSPNGSENIENEMFRVYGNYIASLNLKVFNRIGEKVFESNDMNIGWDGKYNEEYAPMGVYTYLTRIVLLNNKIIEKNGTVTLVR